MYNNNYFPRGGDTTDPTDSNNNNTKPTMEFDPISTSIRLHAQEIAEVKKAQQFLKKQARRREMDKTWLDRCITATIEGWENVWRWEVIDVKK